MDDKKPADGYREPFSWDQLEELYCKGVDLDENSRQLLLQEVLPGRLDLQAELTELWQEKGCRLLDVLPTISCQTWESLYQEEGCPEFIEGYQILHEIDRGGMGRVYKAEQAPPLKREVAIKVLPSSLCSTEWRHLFQLEQRALSKMCHPYVATVYDSGVTPKGQPFFVMEFLDGQPITEYCDFHRLNPHERVVLFTKVCAGLQHAHQKRLIHCDMKPSNVLVVERNGEAVPKIIDFGIAKQAAKGEPEDKKLVMGTLPYMSPEQAAAHYEEIDTRTDVHGLGVLLYELLTGKTPLDRELKTASSEEKRRLIRNVTPVAPSYRIVPRDKDCLALASKRRVGIGALKKSLRGELDWIIMKALAKQPEHRYASCSEFCEDLNCWLQRLPVKAAPEKTWYPLKLWLVRHWRAALAAAGVLVALVISLLIALTSWQEVSLASRKLQNIHDFSLSIFKSVDPYHQGSEIKAVELLDAAADRVATQYEDEPEMEAEIRMILAGSYRDLGSYPEAEEQFAKAREKFLLAGGKGDLKNLPRKTLQAMLGLAFAYFQDHDVGMAAHFYALGLEESKRRFGELDPLSLSFSGGLASVLGHRGQTAEADTYYRKTLEGLIRLRGEWHEHTLNNLSNYASFLIAHKRLDEAENLLTNALDHQREQEADVTPLTLHLMHHSGNLAYSRRRYELAEEYYLQTLQGRSRLLGRNHPDTLMTLNNLALAQGEGHKLEEALNLLRSTLATIPQEAKTHSVRLIMRHNLGHLLVKAEAFESAERELWDTWCRRIELLGRNHFDTLVTRATMGESLQKKGDTPAARAIFEEVVGISRETFGENHLHTRSFSALLRDLNHAEAVP